MEEKIAELCEIEVNLYLDYYNDRIKSYKGFIEELESEKKNIINVIYDLLEEDYTEKEILSAIKSQGTFYKESPEYFGEDDDSSNYPSEYYETEKKEKYPSHENCGSTLSLVKRFFTTRKSVKTEYAYQKSVFNNVDDGIREKVYEITKTMKTMKSMKKKTKRKKKKNKKKKKGTKRKRS